MCYRKNKKKILKRNIHRKFLGYTTRFYTYISALLHAIWYQIYLTWFTTYHILWYFPYLLLPHPVHTYIKLKSHISFFFLFYFWLQLCAKRQYIYVCRYAQLCQINYVRLLGGVTWWHVPHFVWYFRWVYTRWIKSIDIFLDIYTYLHRYSIDWKECQWYGIFPNFMVLKSWMRLVNN